jgi:hypothetical protein
MGRRVACWLVSNDSKEPAAYILMTEDGKYSTQKIEDIASSRVLVTSYQITRRHVTENNNCQCNRRGQINLILIPHFVLLNDKKGLNKELFPDFMFDVIGGGGGG